MKKIEVSEDDRDGLRRAIQTARVALAAVEAEFIRAGLGSTKADTPEKKTFSVDRFKDSLLNKKEKADVE